MTPAEIIRKAMPGAADATCDHVLWGRTPFPMGKVTARSIYQAAMRLKRAAANGLRLCDCCDNVAMKDDWCCEACARVIRSANENSTAETDYTDIIERLQAAKGRDPDINQAIARLEWGPLAPGMSYPFALDYTGSIDAAWTLIPGDWDRSISGPGYDHKKNARTEFVAIVREYRNTTECRQDIEGAGRHSVPAVAVCIAAFEAKQQVNRKNENTTT